jgi:hypothetical protein
VASVSFGSKSLPPPTAEQKRREALIRERGCVACMMAALYPQCGPTEIHHLTIGDKHGAPRLGHDFTVGLGAWHHRGVVLEEVPLETHMEVMYGPSFAVTPKAFRNEYGDGARLLEYQNETIGWTAPPVRERRKNRKTTAAANQVKRPASGFCR